MTILFWMDDWNTIHPKKDTTYLLIKACFNQGLTPYFIQQVQINHGEFFATVAAFQPFNLGEPLSISSTQTTLSATEITAVWIRKDPPVDSVYSHTLRLLDQYKHQFHCFNDPNGVLLNNEKLSANAFQRITPPTLVASSKALIVEFINTYDQVILKPLDGFGGDGIFKVSANDTNIDPMIELLTHHQHQFIICQKMVDHSQGDKRIILVNGEPIGAVKRINYNGHRNNFMAGGLAEMTTIDAQDMAIIKEIKPFILDNGLFFTGIDIVDNHLIEINVTSPTGLQEMNALGNASLHDSVIGKMKEVLTCQTHAN